MNFKLEHHNKILTILDSLDHEVLKKGSAYFGGGTLHLILENTDGVRMLISFLQLLHQVIRTFAPLYLTVAMKDYSAI